MTKYSSLLKAAENFYDKKYFIFDMDGLIFDSERLFMEQLTIAMSEHGYTLSKDIYEHTIGMAGESLKSFMLETFGSDYPFVEISSIARARTNIVANTTGLTIKPEIVDLLNLLKAKKISCAVASSSSGDTVGKYLKVAGIDSFFGHIVSGDRVERSKPEPDIFLLALKECGISCEEAVILEDSVNGVKAACSAGVPVICIPDMVMPGEEVLSMVHSLVIR